jgi:hypothetical protein
MFVYLLSFFLLSSRYFVVLKYFLVPLEFGGGGDANALHAAPQSPKL